MKNALIVLNETADPAPSGNRLSESLTMHHANRVLSYLMDMTVSELFPVEGGYHLFLASYTDEDQSRLRSRLGDTFQYLTLTGEDPVGRLVSVLHHLSDYDRFIFLKSNTVGVEETAVQDWFHRLEQFDILFGPAGESPYFMVGFTREVQEELSKLRAWQQELVDELEVAGEFHAYHVAGRPVAESLQGLTRIRQQVGDRSGLAIRIDDIILGLTAFDEDTPPDPGETT